MWANGTWALRTANRPTSWTLAVENNCLETSDVAQKAGIDVPISMTCALRESLAKRNWRQWSFCRPHLDEQLMVALTRGGLTLTSSFSIQKVSTVRAGIRRRAQNDIGICEGSSQAALADLLLATASELEERKHPGWAC
jgi:hypothetical protein